MLEILYILAGILILPGLIYGAFTQINVSRTFNAFNNFQSKSGLKANEVARIMLDDAGLRDVQIKKIKGHLTDNYNPKEKVLNLSESTFDSTSISAIGVAGHEVGHAIQHKEGYAPLKIRSALVPVVNFANGMFWPLFVIGIILLVVLENSSAGQIVMWIAVAFYASSTVFYLVTLPVEFNASKRALKILSSGILSEEETPYAQKVLSSAAQTYVATLVTSALYFLRFLFYILIIFKKDD